MGLQGMAPRGRDQLGLLFPCSSQAGAPLALLLFTSSGPAILAVCGGLVLGSRLWQSAGVLWSRHLPVCPSSTTRLSWHPHLL